MFLATRMGFFCRFFCFFCRCFCCMGNIDISVARLYGRLLSAAVNRIGVEYMVVQFLRLVNEQLQKWKSNTVHWITAGWWSHFCYGVHSEWSASINMTINQLVVLFIKSKTTRIPITVHRSTCYIPQIAEVTRWRKYKLHVCCHIGGNNWRCIRGCEWVAETQRRTTYCWDLQYGSWSTGPRVTFHHSSSSRWHS